MAERIRWLIVCLYAAAMAWMEAAVVLYLRVLVNRLDPYQADPLPISVGLGQTEVIREAATLLMLLTVGWLAGRTWRSRLGYTLIAFGVWDIFYYIFLIPISGWPNSLLDWDVLFLIPLPWWGPVLAPTLIAALMVVGGTLVSQFDTPTRPVWPRGWTWALNLTGCGLALYVFMTDALRALSGGEMAVRNVLPTSFNWPLFIVGLGLMAVPIFQVTHHLRRGQTA